MATGLAWYLDEIGRHPLLTPADEIELGTQIQRWLTHPEPVPPGIRRRGQRARDRFVQCNLRLVVNYVAKRCHRLVKAHSQDDLIQAANMGLITAVERFDPARGYRFSTYAYWWIRQAIARYCDQHGRTIAIPGSHSEHLSRLGGVTTQLRQLLGREPTRQELADGLGVSMAVFESLEINAKPIQSLDMLVADDLELGDCIAAHDCTLEQQEDEEQRLRQAEQLRQMLSRLPPDDQRLVERAYGLNGQAISLQDLAVEMGISTRRLNIELRRIHHQLSTVAVQLVLVSVEPRPVVPLPKKPRRKLPKVFVQLALWPSIPPPSGSAHQLAA